MQSDAAQVRESVKKAWTHPSIGCAVASEVMVPEIVADSACAGMATTEDASNAPTTAAMTRFTAVPMKRAFASSFESRRGRASATYQQWGTFARRVVLVVLCGFGRPPGPQRGLPNPYQIHNLPVWHVARPGARLLEERLLALHDTSRSTARVRANRGRT